MGNFNLIKNTKKPHTILLYHPTKISTKMNNKFSFDSPQRKTSD